MKKFVPYLFYALAIFFLVIIGLVKGGFLYFGISAYAHYRPNEAETKQFEAAILELRESAENKSFEKIKRELGENDRSPRFIGDAIENLIKIRENYGKPLSTTFFRSMPPDSESEYARSLKGKYYSMFYLSKGEKGEFSEWIEWVVKEEGEVTLLSYRGSELIEWQRESVARENYLNGVLPNEIRIPFGERFLEIRY